MSDKRVCFDFEVDFSNGGGIQGQDFRLDIDGDDIGDDALAAYIIRDLRLLMVGEVRILNKRIIEERHKRAAAAEVRPESEGAGAFIDLSHTIESGMITYKGLPAPLALVAALAIGLVAGIANGWLVAATGISAFIITLASLSIFKGINLGITEAQPFYGIPEAVKAVGSARWGAIPAMLLVALPIVIALAFFLRHAVAGRQLLAYGGNPHAAELSGISPAKV